MTYKYGLYYLVHIPHRNVSIGMLTNFFIDPMYNCYLILMSEKVLIIRVMASDNGDASSDFIPRDYQIEIFEEACRQNVVACLGTGTGKTFISVLLIKELAHQIKGKLCEGGKRTFFLVTTGMSCSNST